MRGVVEKIVRIRKEGKTPFDAITIDGENYSCFDLKQSKDISEGHVVEFDFETSGDYKNIKKISVVKSEPKEAKKDFMPRYVALKAASEFGAARGYDTDGVVEAARKYEKYLREG